MYTRTPQYTSVGRVDHIYRPAPRVQPTERQMAFLRTVSRITDNLYLCGAPAVRPETLTQLNIKCVITITIEMPAVNQSGVRALKISINDDISARILPHFETCIAMIERTRREGGNTLVHCMAGVSRSASVCIAYLMKTRRYTLLQAYNHVKEIRAIIRPNIGFFRQLITYEKQLFGQNSVKMVNSPIGAIPDVYEEQLRNMVFLPTYDNVNRFRAAIAQR